MNTLSVWRFATPDGAEVALRTFERLQHQRLITIDDAAVVVWPDGRRRPRTYQAGTTAGTAALSGAFWGLLFGLVFLLPLAGMAIGTATGLAVGLSRVGLSDEFLRRIHEGITPGTSALFLLTDEAVHDRIREAFAGDHVELLVGNLTPAQEDALRQAFEADDDYADVDSAIRG